MIAETNENTLTTVACGKCHQQTVADHSSAKYGTVCEACWLEGHQKGFVFDEYDLQPDELTKEQFADKAGVSLRAVEIWKADGKIEAQKLRRRVNGVVRKQLIFKTADVEQFLNSSNEPVNMPKVERESSQLQKTNADEQANFLNSSQMFVAEKLLEAAKTMENFTKQLNPSPVEPESKFLSVPAASVEFGLAQAEIKRLIKENIIRGFAGSKGETLVSRRQIEML